MIDPVVLLDAAADLVTVVGLVFVVYQVRQMKHSVRSGAVSAIYAQAAEVRKVLIEHPHLIPYFFGNETVSEDEAVYPLARTVAEMHLNYLEHLAIERDKFGGDNWKAWRSFIIRSVDHSPLLRQLLRENPGAYATALHDVVASRLGD